MMSDDVDWKNNEKAAIQAAFCLSIKDRAI